jgi:hypothetical protein
LIFQAQVLEGLKTTAIHERSLVRLAFWKACRQGNHGELIRLLGKGVSTDLASGNTPLMITVRIGHVLLFRTLLGHGGLTYILPPGSFSTDGLLFEGYEELGENRIQMVKALLEERVPFDRDCALRKAIRRYNIDMMKLLIPHIMLLHTLS